MPEVEVYHLHPLVDGAGCHGRPPIPGRWLPPPFKKVPPCCPPSQPVPCPVVSPPLSAIPCCPAQRLSCSLRSYPPLHIILSRHHLHPIDRLFRSSGALAALSDVPGPPSMPPFCPFHLTCPIHPIRMAPRYCCLSRPYRLPCPVQPRPGTLRRSTRPPAAHAATHVP